MKTVKYLMMPNTTIYKQDVLKVVNGRVQPITQKDGNPRNLLLGKGPDKFKIATEYKVSSNKTTTIEILEDMYQTMNVETGETTSTTWCNECKNVNKENLVCNINKENDGNCKDFKLHPELQYQIEDYM